MKKRFAILSMGGLLLSAGNSFALELDWSGQFRAEYNFIHNYEMDNTDAASVYDATRAAANGYYVPSGGGNDANFQTLFLKLQPKLVVNDNIYIKSEWWLGDPVYGFFGNGVPYTSDQRFWYSSQNRGSPITAQRFWAEFISDLGTFQVGRTPLNWGLGIFWNDGNGIWDRYESTGDSIRLISKFGAFSFVPAFIAYSAGNNVGGACNPQFVGGVYTGCTTQNFGEGGVVDYSLQLKYENPDEDFEGGLNFVKRIIAAAQDPTAGYLGWAGKNQSQGSAYNVWDIYGRKKFGRFGIGGELPVTSGNVGGLDYGTWALALEGNWRPSDPWETQLKLGHAPGQPNATDKFRPFYFNPDYHVGMIMFNYQLANFAGPNTLNNPGVPQNALLSPYDNPIVNANYINIGEVLHADKWTFNADFTYAHALETAVAGQSFYNYWSRSFATATQDQASTLGWEMDYGAAFQWDEYFQLRWDFGFFFPGGFYAFSNTSAGNLTSMVFGTSMRVGVSF